MFTFCYCLSDNIINAYTLKRIRFSRNPKKRIRRQEKASEWIQMPKNRILNSIESLKVLPVSPRVEPFPKKLIFSLANFKKSFVKKFETFRASYETFKGSVQNQYFLRVHCEILEGFTWNSKSYEFFYVRKVSSTFEFLLLTFAHIPVLILKPLE